jgi:hypothetical protein
MYACIGVEVYHKLASLTPDHKQTGDSVNLKLITHSCRNLTLTHCRNLTLTHCRNLTQTHCRNLTCRLVRHTPSECRATRTCEVCMYVYIYIWLARCDVMVQLTTFISQRCMYIQTTLSICGEQEPSRQPLCPSGEHLAGPRLGEVGLLVKQWRDCAVEERHHPIRIHSL